MEQGKIYHKIEKKVFECLGYIPSNNIRYLLLSENYYLEILNDAKERAHLGNNKFLGSGSFYEPIQTVDKICFDGGVTLSLVLDRNSNDRLEIVPTFAYSRNYRIDCR